MSELSDKEQQAIREMRRVRPPSMRSFVVNAAIYAPAAVLAALGVGVVLLGGRVKFGALGLFLALSWAVGASRSWDTAQHRRQTQRWLWLAGGGIAVLFTLLAGLFVGLGGPELLFPPERPEARAAALRSVVAEHAEVLARREERQRRVGGWRESWGPRPDLGACADPSGELDGLHPQLREERSARALGPDTVTVVYPSGVEVFDEDGTDYDMQEFTAQLAHPGDYAEEDQRLLDRGPLLNHEASRLVYLVVDEYSGSDLHGTAFTLDADAERPGCAAYISVHGSSARPEELAALVDRAVTGAPWHVAGEIERDVARVESPYVVFVDGVAQAIPLTGGTGLAGLASMQARIEVVPLVTYVGQGFSLQHPPEAMPADSSPQPLVELLLEDGTALSVARAPCDELAPAYNGILGALGQGEGRRDGVRMLGEARVSGSVATLTSGLVEVYLHMEDTRCTMVLLETPRAIAPTWLNQALASLQDAPHPVVAVHELVVDGTRTPMPLGSVQTITDPRAIDDGEHRIEVRPNPERHAYIGGLRVEVPEGAFARVEGGTSNESTLHVVEGQRRLELRVAHAPSSTWHSSDERLAALISGGATPTSARFLGDTRAGAAYDTASGARRTFTFDHHDRLVEASVEHAHRDSPARADAWASAIVEGLETTR